MQRPDGSSVAVGTLWAERPTLLVLVRHYGCQFCREQIAHLRRILGDLEPAGVGVVRTRFGALEAETTPRTRQSSAPSEGLQSLLSTS